MTAGGVEREAPAEGVRRLCELLQRGGSLTFHPERLVDQIGRGLFDALIHARVIEAAEPATEYRCGGPLGSGCPRQVLPSESNRRFPFVAVCGQSPVRCRTVQLSAADLEQVRVSTTAFARLLGRLLGVDAVPDAALPVGARFLLVGRAPWHGRAHEILLATDPLADAFPVDLMARKLEAVPSVVAIPTRFMLPAGLAAIYAPVDYVKVLVLEDVLHLEDGELRLRVPPGHPAVRGAAGGGDLMPLHVPGPAADHCLLVNEAGVERRIARDEYEELDARRPEYSLFVDGTKHERRHTHPAWRGKSKRPSLSASEVALLRVLLQREDAVSFAELKDKLGVSCPHKVFESLRRKLDPGNAETGWRWLGVNGRGKPAAKSFLLERPRGFRCAVLLSLKTAR